MRHVLANLRVRFAVIGASITMLAALVGWWIASRVTRPVTRLTAATEAIAESGRLDVDVPAGGSDETGRLAHSFAMMLDALRRSREQQQRLAQDAGHELRTPLTSLRTNVEVLRRHPELEPATRDRVLGDIHSELRELTVVTNELVALATEEADDEPTQAIDVDALARRAAARTERRRRRTVVVDAEPWSVSGQPRQLLRVLDNLLDNAAKFDPSTAPIEVVVRPGTITVRDHGAGIDPTDQLRVFDRFYRAPSARAQPGSGLGLAIASDVVHRHGGTIRRHQPPGRRGAHHRSRCRRWTRVSPARPPHRRSRRPTGRRRCLTRRLPEPDRSLTRRPNTLSCGPPTDLPNPADLRPPRCRPRAPRPAHGLDRRRRHRRCRHLLGGRGDVRSCEDGAIHDDRGHPVDRRRHDAGVPATVPPTVPDTSSAPNCERSVVRRSGRHGAAHAGAPGAGATTGDQRPAAPPERRGHDRRVMRPPVAALARSSFPALGTTCGRRHGGARPRRRDRGGRG